MPFILSPMTEEDIPAFALIDERAMAGWPMAEAMLEPGQRRGPFVENLTRQGWGRESTAHWVKATDAASSEIAAVSLWRFKIDGDDEAEEQPTPKDAPAPAAEGADLIGDGADGGAGEKKKKTIFDEIGRLWAVFKQECVGDRPYATLSILVTDPKFQRQGAGGLLVQWGCDKADDLGLVLALEASAAGLPLYQRAGFEVVHVAELDLRPFGVNDSEQRRGMIRHPRRKS